VLELLTHGSTRARGGSLESRRRSATVR